MFSSRQSPRQRRCFPTVWLFLIVLSIASAAESDTRQFDIPAEKAEKTLQQFAAQSGVEVLFSTQAAAGVRTNAVKGRFTPLQAVARMIDGTPLVVVQDSKNSVLRISRAPDPNVPRAAPASSVRPKAADDTRGSTATIAGRVADGATGKSLHGAIVRVAGTSVSAATDALGRYTLAGIPAGAQQIEVEYIGLDSFRQDVVVTPGASLTLHVTLNSEVLRLESFTVAETARGQALAINQQKTARGIVNIVSEETFGQMTNGNIGYALQRLPGLTVSQDIDGSPTSVNIRGLSADYNSFQIDGNRTPTATGSRGLITNQLAADAISNIEVIKAPTPDRDGDAIGGIINVISRSAFQREGREIRLTASALHYDLADRLGYNSALTYSDIHSVGGGEKNLGLSLTLGANRIDTDYENTDLDFLYLTPANNPALNLAQPVYFNTVANVQRTFKDTRTYDAGAAIDFRLSQATSFYLRPVFSHYDFVSEAPRFRMFINTNHGDAPTAPKSIAFATPTAGQSLPGTLNEYRYENAITKSDYDLVSVSAGGRHEFDASVLDLDLFVSTNHRRNPRVITYNFRNPGFVTAYERSNALRPSFRIVNGKSPSDLSAVNRGDLTLAPSSKLEKVYSAKADWEHRFTGERYSVAVKLGAKYRSSLPRADFDSNVYRTGTAAGGFPYGGIVRASNRSPNGIPMPLEPDITAVERLFTSEPARFVHQANLQANLARDYQGEENTAAGYVMGTLARGATSLILGLRSERNTWQAKVYEFNARTPDAPVRLTRTSDYTVWLPGAHLRHEFRKNLIFRASYNRSYGRPELATLAQARVVDPINLTISDGNPNLAPTTSNNYDAQLELYTPRGGLYSAGFFYKDIEGFYYSSTGTETLAVDGVSRVFTTTRKVNGEGGRNYGVELIARQNLFFLPRPFGGLSVSLSATFTESEAKYPTRRGEKLPTTGFSDTIFYSAVHYAIGRFEAQVSYRYRSEYIEALDASAVLDDFFAAREQFDWESSFRLNKRCSIFLNVENLTRRPQVSYQGVPQIVEDYTSYSPRVIVGAAFRF